MAYSYEKGRRNYLVDDQDDYSSTSSEGINYWRRLKDQHCKKWTVHLFFAIIAVIIIALIAAIVGAVAHHKSDG